MSYRTLDIQPLAGALGAEVHGIDLAGDIGEAQFAELRHAFGEYGVIFFRDQGLSPEQHIGFAERWGAININRFFATVDGYPMIARSAQRAAPGKKHRRRLAHRPLL